MSDPALAELLDRARITELIGPRYSHALDWYDLPMLKACFHADAIADYGYFVGPAHEWCERVGSPEPGAINRFHYIFPGLITLAGDTAECSSTGLTGKRVQGQDGIACTYNGTRYVDIVTRRDGTWRIARRTARLDFVEVTTGTDPLALGVKVPLLQGCSPAHPLYRAHAAA